MFDQKDAEKIREEMKGCLAGIAEKYNAVLKTVNIRYSDRQIEADISMACKEGAADREREEFERLCSRYGFEKSDYIRVYTVQWDSGKTVQYRLYGFDPKRRTYPCKVIRLYDGKDLLISRQDLIPVEEIKVIVNDVTSETPKK